MVKGKRTKNRIGTNTRRTIFRAFPRFLSLMVMSFLGVFVFAGLMATAPDMIATLDRSFDEHLVYDIRVVSDKGLEEADLEAVKALDGVETAELSKGVDVVAAWADNTAVLTLAALPEQMNTITLLEGRLPEGAGEIVVEKNMLEKTELSLGDHIFLDTEDLSETDVVIVGTVDSALYYNNVGLNQSRGSTGVGSGKIDYYAYGTLDGFSTDYYTVLYVRVEGAAAEMTSYEGYVDLVDAVKESIEDIASEREKARYDSLYQKGVDEIEDAASEPRQELAEAKEDLEEAAQEIRDGEDAIADGEQELSDALPEIEENEKKLSDAKVELDRAEKELRDTKAQLDETKEQLDTSKAELDMLGLLLQQYPDATKKAQYEAGLLIWEQGNAAYESGLSRWKKGQKEYNASKADYLEGCDALKEAKEKYNDGVTELEDHRIELADAKEEYEKGLQEYLEAEDDLNREVAEAYEELEELELPNWYVYDRTGNSTYNDYIDDSNSIRNLGTLFPVVFFAVAVLISLISMNRMVEEDRLEIGTMKSMGFPNRLILRKYLVFSLLATLSGGLLGAAGGLIVIPELIFFIYTILFTLPSLVITLQPLYTGLGFVLTILCVCGTSVLTAEKVLREKPSDLMRPKAPKSGRRILLERIPFVWNRMKFSRKVTVRNILRYKKRVLITIGGIAGCTALMLTGFGVKDAIVDVPSSQYYDIFQFDGTVFVGDGEAAEAILKEPEVTDIALAQRVTVDIDGYNGYLLVVDSAKELPQIAHFSDDKTGEAVELETGKCIVDEKLSALSGVKAGDVITVMDPDNQALEVEISSVVSNYIEHFAYMDAETYEGLGFSFTPNLVYLQTEALTEEGRDALAQRLLLKDEVMNVTFRSDLIESVDNSLKSLDSVVLILIVLSALLDFVVLYNLSNINITERKREIATLKVLGFYNKEVDDYITKENIILTILGIALGLVVGIFLSRAVVNAIEIEKCRFINELKAMSFVYSALLTAAFTGIVAFITHFNLKRVDMIDSLKSVE